MSRLRKTNGLGMMPIQTSYMMSKHAILSFSECLYLEMQLKKANVQVSAVLPGPVATRIFADAKGTDDPMIAHHRESMRQFLEAQGITPVEAAKRIFTQIAAGEFWVSTHPEITRMMADGRVRYLTGLNKPALNEDMLATLNGK